MEEDWHPAVRGVPVAAAVAPVAVLLRIFIPVDAAAARGADGGDRGQNAQRDEPGLARHGLNLLAVNGRRHDDADAENEGGRENGSGDVLLLEDFFVQLAGREFVE